MLWAQTKHYHKFSHRQSGFSMMELLVAIVILGIIGAIAIPSFNGGRKRATNQEGRNQLTSAYEASKNFYNGDRNPNGRGTYTNMCSGTSEATATAANQTCQTVSAASEPMSSVEKQLKWSQGSPAVAPNASNDTKNVKIVEAFEDTVTLCNSNDVYVYCVKDTGEAPYYGVSKTSQSEAVSRAASWGCVDLGKAEIKADNGGSGSGC